MPLARFSRPDTADCSSASSTAASAQKVVPHIKSGVSSFSRASRRLRIESCRPQSPSTRRTSASKREEIQALAHAPRRFLFIPIPMARVSVVRGTCWLSGNPALGQIGVSISKSDVHPVLAVGSPEQTFSHELPPSWDSALLCHQPEGWQHGAWDFLGIGSKRRKANKG